MATIYTAIEVIIVSREKGASFSSIVLPFLVNYLIVICRTRSHQPQSVAVSADNSPNLSKEDYNMNLQESTYGSLPPHNFVGDYSLELDPM